MTAILSNAAIGQYTGTWNGGALGLVEGPYNLSWTPLATPIRCDYYGDTIIDYILTGADAFVSLIIKEWTTEIMAALFPECGGELGQVGDDHANDIPAGRLATSVAKALVLTPKTGSLAQTATDGKTLYTAAFALPLPGTAINIPMGTVERNIPVTFALLPDLAGTQIQHFVAS